MDSNYSAIDPQASPPIFQLSKYSYFAEQARRAGYLGPELGRTQQEYFQYHHHFLHPPRHPPPHSHCVPQPHPLDMQAVIEREVEKEQIRKEIIMSEIARRHVLETEVRRELVMERELAMQRGRDEFPFSLPAILFESSKRSPCLGTRLEERFLVEIIAMLLDERERLIGMRESGGFDTLPFQRGTADLRISEVKPATEEGKEKEKIILLAKPDENISESKRKAITLPGVGATPLDDFLKKKAKEEWSCALCQFSAFTERKLNEHLCGRKHKKKVAKLQGAQRGSKNYRIGLYPKKTTCHKFAAESLPFNKAQVTTSKKDSKKDYLPLLQENQNLRAAMKKRFRAHGRSRKRQSAT